MTQESVIRKNTITLKKKIDSPAIELLKSGGAKRIELNEPFSCYIGPASYFGDYSVQPAVFSW